MVLLIVFGAGGLLLIGLGALIRFKKTYWMISGVNTSSPERRAQMDLDAICTVTGNALMVGGLLFAAAGLLYFLGVTVALFILIAVFILEILGAAMYARRYDYGRFNADGRLKASEKAMYVILGVVAVSVVGLMVWIFLLTSGGKDAPVVTMEGETLHVESTFGCTIPKDQIVGVTLTETLPSLSRTNGMGLGVYQRGQYRAGGLGSGRAYLKTDCPPFILVTLNGEKNDFLFLNLYDPEQTKALYEQICAWTGPLGGV